MASSRLGISTALRGVRPSSRGQWRPLDQQFQALQLFNDPKSTRCLSTDAGSFEDFLKTQQDQAIQAAPGINLADIVDFRNISYARAVPVSPSYFSRQPRFNDSYLALQKLMQSYGKLPVVSTGEVERVAWKSLVEFRQMVGERVKASDYVKCLEIIKRLHRIHPELKPPIFVEAFQAFKRDIQPFTNKPNPIRIDWVGRALGIGRRKSSVARAYVIEGNGEVLINGKTLADAFGRVHDRESAVWALRATDRLDKYNVWALVAGGGTTGQAEALTLAIAKGLMAHEPALKPALRRAGCVTRDMRRVERKKHGRVKARKMPTWVKR
ncbi:ribosomal protein S5 domain 2-type protein [Lasiosphaeria miniovina]|uniref:Small ribosomal subunit protein uS9m n=1 Tax=Lasiosphaeria miniovina TaxID=1954250 RepID=A0AA40E802_9PEZI|nr:ribosomal protein S5 domain 2-type protein [Lasiosphaeria miniovina]KAK0727371.1 ribosomal protein S5 domain 2-type protein [Lasiosphaeria miniovina]